MSIEPNRSPKPRLRLGIQLACVLALAALAFLGGRTIAQRRAEPAIRQARDAADAARAQAEQARLQLERMRTPPVGEVP